MSKARMYGTNRRCVPNRDADMRKRNNMYFKGRDFAEKSIDRYERKFEKRMQIMKEEKSVCP